MKHQEISGWQDEQSEIVEYYTVDPVSDGSGSMIDGRLYIVLDFPEFK